MQMKVTVHRDIGTVLFCFPFQKNRGNHMSDTSVPGAITRPDPANIVASNAYIMDLLERLLQERGEKRICAAEAARAIGLSRNVYAGHPWRIPNFAPRGAMFPLSVWRAWYEEKPDHARRQEWDILPLKEKQRLRGIA